MVHKVPHHRRASKSMALGEHPNDFTIRDLEA